MNGGVTHKPLIVILGGLGFIGSHLSRALVHDGFKVRIFDKLYASHELINDIETCVELIEGDIERVQDVLNALSGGEICFHLVHTTVPGSSMQDPVFDIQSNVISSVKWMSQLNRTSIKRLIYISSGGTVYGIPQTNPITEDHPTNPTCSYGITKLCVEKYIALYANLYGIPYRIARASNAYGEEQRLNIQQGVIGVFVDKVLHGEPIEVWGDGNILRDYLYISDLVSALVALINHQGPSYIFNISSGKGHSLFEIIEMIEKIAETKAKIKFMESRGFDVPVNILSSNRLMDETSWIPKVSLYEGIYHYIQWFREHILKSDIK